MTLKEAMEWLAAANSNGEAYRAIKRQMICLRTLRDEAIRIFQDDVANGSHDARVEWLEYAELTDTDTEDSGWSGVGRTQND